MSAVSFAFAFGLDGFGGGGERWDLRDKILCSRVPGVGFRVILERVVKADCWSVAQLFGLTVCSGLL